MKKFISLLSVIAVIAAMLVSTVSAATINCGSYDASRNTYTIIGDPVVDSDSNTNEVIFGDDFNRGPSGSGLTNSGWDRNLYVNATTDNTAFPSSSHGLAWYFHTNQAPASKTKYLGKWNITAKDENAEIKDYYFEIATGQDAGGSADHMFRAPLGDYFKGAGEYAGVYAIEFDFLFGGATSFMVRGQNTELYSGSHLPFLELYSDNSSSTPKSYNKRFDLSKWHHATIIIDEINKDWYTLIDNELVNDMSRGTSTEFTAVQGTKYIRFIFDMPSDACSGLDNVYIRKLGNRTLVYDSEAYYFEDGVSANYTNLATANNRVDTLIPSDATSIIVTKTIVNESSVTKNYKVIAASYANDDTIQRVYTDSEIYSVAPYSRYFLNEIFELDAETEKVKVFLWDGLDNIIPIMEEEEFIKSTN